MREERQKGGEAARAGAAGLQRLCMNAEAEAEAEAEASMRAVQQQRHGRRFQKNLKMGAQGSEVELNICFEYKPTGLS